VRGVSEQERPRPESLWTTVGDPLARPLLESLERDYVAWYGPGASQEMTRYPAERFGREAGGAFLLLLVDGAAVAGGAYMRDEQGDAEIKRMWTHPEHRRRGLANRVLDELQADAAAHGYTRMVLSTGWAQEHAVALYIAAGWTPDTDLDGDWRERGWLSFHRELARSDP
jgi:ribosomal protein S18 acetylase RimI-like enzyme